MDFSEYRKIIENTPETQGMEYRLAVVWLHPERLPLSVASFGNCADKVIRVPQYAETRYGRRVPVLSVDSGVFSGNTEVTDIILGSGIDKIDAGAFSGCSALERITIPRAVKRIAAGTFAGCTSLKDVYYEGTPEEWKALINRSVTRGNHSVFYFDNVHFAEAEESEGDEADVTYITSGAVEPNATETVSETEDTDESNVTSAADETNATETASATEYTDKPDVASATVETTAEDTASETTGQKGLSGDANNDGKINVADAVAALQFIANKEKYPLSDEGQENADVDGVKGITGGDAIVIQKMDAGLF